MKINRAIFCYIEYELYHYRKSRKMIAEIRDDIINSSSAGKKEIQSDCGLADSTAAKASKLISSPALMKLEKNVGAIDDGIARLSDVHKQLFELKYIQNKEFDYICDMIPISRRSYFRLRKDIVAMVGWYMGIVSDVMVD